MYSKEQYRFMLKCKDGLIWTWFKDANADEVLRYLMDEGLVQPRQDIKEGMYKLTQKGISELENYKDVCREKAARKKQSAKNAVQAQKDSKRDFNRQFILVVISAVVEKLGVLCQICSQLVNSLFK